MKYDGLPTLPASVDLDDTGAAMWHLALETIPDEVLSAADGPALASMCQWWSMYCVLQERYLEELDPRVGRQCRAAHEAFLKLADSFGMTPSKRQSMRVAPQEDNSGDPMAAKLGVVRDDD